MSIRNLDRYTVIALLMAATAVYGVSIALTGDNTSSTVTVTVNTPTGPTALTATPPDQATHDGARDETPPGVDAEALNANLDQMDDYAERDHLPLNAPLAAPYQRGCRSMFHNSYGSRGGVAPRLFVYHYTVSPNLPGFRDLLNLTAYAANSRNGVSWHFNIDQDGNCIYSVAEANKAWTQATMNRVSIGMEIINTGRERPLFTDRGLRRMARVVSDSALRWGIPIRRGAIDRRTCTVTRSGQLDHRDLGACGGGHIDITPFDVDELIKAVRSYRRADTLRARRCAELRRIRRSSTGHRWTAPKIARARALKSALGAGAARCV